MNRKLIWFISVLVAVFFAFSYDPIASADKDIRVIKPTRNFIGEGVDKEKITKKNGLFKRVIADGIFDEKDINQFKSKGCKLKHRLKRSSSFECPIDIIPELNVRESRIFHIIDLEADCQIKANLVWDEGISGEGVIVAILDSGIDSTHIELQDYNPDPQESDGIIGQKDFVSDVDDDYIAEDENGHGTHVAGIITANGVLEIEGTGGNRATGVAPGAGIFMLKVCDADGYCYEDDMVAAMQYVVENVPAKVMSISIGGGNFGDHCDSDPLAAEVNWVVDNGITVVVAAGNDGAGVSAPACASKAIAVGAVDRYGEVPYWSNRGTALDIVAPGVDILSTYSCMAPGAGNCNDVYWYTYISGTSMSAPHVSGVVALLLQANPTATTEQIKSALYENADPVAVCYECIEYFDFLGLILCLVYGVAEDGCTTEITGAGIVNAYGSYLAITSTEPACLTDSECDDSNECTDDVCENPGMPQAYCSHTPKSGNTCDDGLFCTLNDTCTDGACNGEAKDCSDGIACTVDNCNEVNDECTHTPQDSLCDNGLYCDGIETCNAGIGCSNTGNPCPIGTTCNEVTDTCDSDESCGDGICAGLPDEDCSTCPSDCPGKSTGKPSNRWCCGNLTCESGETAVICPVDCGGGSCQTNDECNDNDPCTNDICSSGVCLNTWPQCGEADGCCPTGCTSDPDCQCSGFKQICTVDSDCCPGLSCHPVKYYCR